MLVRKVSTRQPRTMLSGEFEVMRGYTRSLLVADKLPTVKHFLSLDTRRLNE
jgi:hypothetical protein